jgi:ketosteroid isomerase-like protein
MMSDADGHEATTDDVEVVRRLNSIFSELDFASLRDVVEGTSSLEELRGGAFEWVAEAIWELVDEDVEISFEGGAGMAEGQSFKGLESWMDLWRAWLAAWEDYSLEAGGYEIRGEQVLVEVVHRGRGRGSGLDVELPQTQLWQVRGGQAVRCRIYASRAEAEAALSGP